MAGTRFQSETVNSYRECRILDFSKKEFLKKFQLNGYKDARYRFGIKNCRIIVREVKIIVALRRFGNGCICLQSVLKIGTQ